MKRTTALVGLTVAKEPRETLLKLYNETLKVLGNMPQSAQYRINAEQITKQRLGLVEQETDVPTLEQKLGAGQIEEVIKQAEDELSLCNKMQDWKPWEPLQTPSPENQWKWP